jgi:hypothetical protein
MKRICVLFAGCAGHGKDTAADMLHECLAKLDVSSTRMAFADPIKDILVHLLGIPKSVTYGTQQDKLDYKVYGKSARYWMQQFGTEIARNQIHKDIWVHRFVEKAIADDAQVVIGGDCRFHNEINLVREMMDGKLDLVVVKIVNPRVPVNLDHQSESEIYHTADGEFDLVIQNSGELLMLLSKVMRLAGEIMDRIS